MEQKYPKRRKIAQRPQYKKVLNQTPFFHYNKAMWVKTASVILLIVLSSLLLEDVVTPHCVPDDNMIFQSSSISHQDSRHANDAPMEHHHVINHFGHCAFVLSTQTVLDLQTASLVNPAIHYHFVLKLNKPARIIRPPIS